MNFWQNLPKPFFVLAPMADVTDAPFRRLIAKYGAHKRADGTVGGPDVTWTEFVAADGLVKATPEGKEKLLADLMYSEAERPIVAQLFTAHPEHMEYAAKLVRELSFDGVDINMGCPDRSVEKQGAGAALMKNPALAKEIIQAAKRGAKMGEKDGIPVSVKTRIGYNKDELEEWLPILLEEEPAVVTVHARTRKEMSKVPARWERVKRAVEIRDEMKSDTLIIGNGDACSLTDARRKAELSGADGVMLGRAVFGNPWLFHPDKALPERANEAQKDNFDLIPLPERLRVMVEHTKLFKELLPFKNFAIMKKHYKAYVNSFPGAAELRAELMEKNTPEEIEKTVENWLAKHNVKATED